MKALVLGICAGFGAYHFAMLAFEYFSLDVLSFWAWTIGAVFLVMTFSSVEE